MNRQLYIDENKGNVKNLTLIIIAFCSVFYPRVLDTIGFPPAINFIHFLIVPFTLGVAIVTTPIKDRRQIAISWQIIGAIFLLLGVMLASALLNKAGIVNIFLDFVLLTEPFMLILAIICLPLSTANLAKLRAWLLVSSAINVILAIIQYFLIETGKLRIIGYSPADGVQGVFYLSGAGNYVSVAISLCVGLYYLIDAKNVSLGWRLFWLLAAFYQLLVSDSKQILIVFVIAWLILVLTKFNKIDKFIFYVIAVTLFLIALFWAIENVDFAGLNAFKYWFSRTELYGPDGEAVNAKMAGINIILSYFKSPLNWLFGLGPGHTVGRLGGWILRDYKDMLLPLGATVHPASLQTWQLMTTNWLILESSMFSPMFTWAGIWGDLGFLGLGVFLYLGYIVWHYLCHDDLSKLFVLTMVVYGLIITQMEEPGQSLTIAILIGLQWHQRQNRRKARLAGATLSPDFQGQPGAAITPLYLKPNKRRF
jgi:hypothetical protein